MGWPVGLKVQPKRLRLASASVPIPSGLPISSTFLKSNALMLSSAYQRSTSPDPRLQLERRSFGLSGPRLAFVYHQLDRSFIYISHNPTGTAPMHIGYGASTSLINAIQ